MVARPTAEAPARPRLAVEGLDAWFGAVHAVRNVWLKLLDRHVTAIIGPSGCGKSTFLRSINRLNALIPGVRHAGAMLLNGERSREALDAVVEQSLKRAALWDEVKDRLRQSALGLSGGQQQRLCIARALANEPEVLLLDEPASALDPIATQKIEELLYELKRELTVVIVTHNLQQAARVSDYTAFFYMGRLVEMDATERLFTSPRSERTDAYITGRFG